MGVKKVVEVLLDKIEFQQSDIMKKREEISVLYGYKEENRRLRDEISSLKKDIEILNSVIEDQKNVINNSTNG